MQAPRASDVERSSSSFRRAGDAASSGTVCVGGRASLRDAGPHSRAARFLRFATSLRYSTRGAHSLIAHSGRSAQQQTVRVSLRDSAARRSPGARSDPRPSARSAAAVAERCSGACRADAPYRPAAARASATRIAPVRGVCPRALVFTCTAAVTPCSAKCMTSVVYREEAAGRRSSRAASAGDEAEAVAHVRPSRADAVDHGARASRRSARRRVA